MWNSSFVFLVFVFSSQIANAQDTLFHSSGNCIYEYDSIRKCNVYTVCTKAASFQNNNGELLEYISQNLIFQDCIENETDFIVDFFVDTFGNVSVTSINSKNSHTLGCFEKQLLEILNKMPNWNPAYCIEKKVCFKSRIPILFCLEE